MTCPFREQLNFQVVLRQATRAGTSKADTRLRATAGTAAPTDPAPGRADGAASRGTGRRVGARLRVAGGRFEGGRPGEHSPDDGRRAGGGPDGDPFAEAGPSRNRPARCG